MKRALFLCLFSCARLAEFDAPAPAASLVPIPLAESMPVKKAPWRWESPTPQGNPIVDLWGDGSGLLLGVGWKGSVIRRVKEEKFTVVTLDTTKHLFSVHGNSKHLFIAGEEGVWRSNNLGLSWDRTSLNKKIYDVLALSSGTVYALGEANQLHISRDSGETWTTTSITQDGDLKMLWASEDGVVLASQPNVAYSKTLPIARYVGDAKGLIKGGSIWRSTDFGATWKALSFSSYTEHPTRFWRSSKGTLFGAGSNHVSIHSQQICGTCMDTNLSTYSVFASDDEGATWRRVKEGVNSTMGMARIFSQPILLGGSAKALWLVVDGEILRSSDEGKTWEKIKPPMDKHQWMLVAFSLWADAEGLVFSANGLHRYKDKTWSRLDSAVLSGAVLRASVGLDDGSVLAVGDGIAKRDATGMWREISSSETSLLTVVRHKETIFAAGSSGLVLRSVDGGETFERLPKKHAGRVHYVNGAWYLTGERGVVVKYIEATNSWKELRKPEESQHTQTLVALSDGSLLLLGNTFTKTERLGAGDMFSGDWKSWLKISKDEGATWKDLAGAPQVSFPGDVLVQEDGTVWLNGDKGILYQTRDVNGAWKEVALPLLVRSMQETTDGRLWVFGSQMYDGSLFTQIVEHQSGGATVFSSVDQGKTWSPESLPLNPYFLQELNDGILWVGGNSIVAR